MFEPYRCKVVEAIPVTTPGFRREALRAAGFNMFNLRAQDITIDLLTDSGTGAMSDAQWAAVQRADEAYAGARSWYEFEETIRDLFGFEFVLPAHQGRAAERLLYTTLCAPRPGGRSLVVPCNTHFDTGRANLELLGVRAVDLPCGEAADLNSDTPFKGNADIVAMAELVRAEGARNIPLILMTVTNNTGGGQPVSMANLTAVSNIARAYGIPFYLDACRFAENAFFIQQFEDGYSSLSISEIVSRMCECVDGCVVSAKKDGLANTGGFLCTNSAELADAARRLGIITEGFSTYGGMSGRDLAAIAVGLREVCEESYLRSRVESTRYMASALRDNGIPVVWPPGGHAVYIDATAFLPHIAPLQYPAQALCSALFEEGGIRSVELGTSAFGYDPLTDTESPAQWELCRLALPRRVYSRNHLDYVVHSLVSVAKHRESLRGMEMVSRNTILRHFTARFRPLTDP
ncbi:tryptophanase [Nocardia sp. NPDC057030]|uniref:tryptophanase n=1 Tax=unclassified Nocardia TaxID=2637762 RepID=UPI0036304A7B